jgi:hypothetical protein
MPSTWIRRRPTKGGDLRYRVEYRIGGARKRLPVCRQFRDEAGGARA